MRDKKKEVCLLLCYKVGFYFAFLKCLFFGLRFYFLIRKKWR